MISISRERIEIKREQDVVFFRLRIKEVATKIKMSTLGQTKLITAASELVRNMLKYANGGEVILEEVSKINLKGIKITFNDFGPGIQDISKAMTNGFSTGKSLGLGLPGAKRLVNEFHIESEVGKGTTITIIRWQNGS